MDTFKISVSEDENEDPEFRSKFTNMVKLHSLLEQANNLLQTMFSERWLSKQATDKQENKHQEFPKEVRSKVAHCPASPAAGISDPDLEALWSKAERVLLHFGFSAEEIHKLKNSTNVAEIENQNTSMVNTETSKVATKFKDEGNILFRDKEYEKAIEVYTKAISLEGLSQVDSGVLDSNRSAAYQGLTEQEAPPLPSLSSEESRHRALEDATEAMMETISPEGTRAMDELVRLYSLYITEEDPPRTPQGTTNSPKIYDPVVLAKFAAQGSVTAKSLLQALKHRNAAMDLLMNGRNNCSEFCREIAACCRYDYKVIQLPREMLFRLSHQMFEYMKTFPKDVLSNENKDFCVCHCHAFLNMFDAEASLRRVEVNKKKYPEEVLFHRVIADLHAFRKDYKTSIKVAQESLKLFPGDVDLLYHVAATAAVLLYYEGKSLTNVVRAYEDFLDAAPKDHRNVPQAYYAIANTYKAEEIRKTNAINHGKKSKRGGGASAAAPDFKLAEKYYELGLEAEKLQLPCYLPYKSIQKQALETSFLMLGLHPDPDPVKTVPTVPSSSPNPAAAAQRELFALLTSPLRIKAIRDHREYVQSYLKYFVNFNKKKKTMVKITAPPKHKQGAPARLTGLKPVLFKDMFQDKVYEDCVLTVTSIEDPADVPTPYIRLVLEDENRDACRAFIYNFEATNFGDIVQQLGYGAKLSIINPYILAADGRCEICVDDPSTLFLHSGNTPNACRFCGKEAAPLKCGRCKRASYCNQECQGTDWKKFQHKLICATE